jgi:hypothetical protein
MADCQCGSPFNTDDQFCGSCGTPRPQTTTTSAASITTTDATVADPANTSRRNLAIGGTVAAVVLLAGIIFLATHGDKANDYGCGSDYDNAGPSLKAATSRDAYVNACKSVVEAANGKNSLAGRVQVESTMNTVTPSTVSSYAGDNSSLSGTGNVEGQTSAPGAVSSGAEYNPNLSATAANSGTNVPATTPATTAPRTTTTVSQGSATPQAAADRLFNAWKAGNRSAAGQASLVPTQNLFAVDPNANAPWSGPTCSAVSPMKQSCVYKAGDSSGMVLTISVTQGSPLWFVDDAEFEQ